MNSTQLQSLKTTELRHPNGISRFVQSHNGRFFAIYCRSGKLKIIDTAEQNVHESNNSNNNSDDQQNVVKTFSNFSPPSRSTETTVEDICCFSHDVNASFFAYASSSFNDNETATTVSISAAAVAVATSSHSNSSENSSTSSSSSSSGSTSCVRIFETKTWTEIKVVHLDFYKSLLCYLEANIQKEDIVNSITSGRILRVKFKQRPSSSSSCHCNCHSCSLKSNHLCVYFQRRDDSNWEADHVMIVKCDIIDNNEEIEKESDDNSSCSSSTSSSSCSSFFTATKTHQLVLPYAKSLKLLDAELPPQFGCSQLKKNHQQQQLLFFLDDHAEKEGSTSSSSIDSNHFFGNKKNFEVLVVLATREILFYTCPELSLLHNDDDNNNNNSGDKDTRSYIVRRIPLAHHTVDQIHFLNNTHVLILQYHKVNNSQYCIKNLSVFKKREKKKKADDDDDSVVVYQVPFADIMVEKRAELSPKRNFLIILSTDLEIDASGFPCGGEFFDAELVPIPHDLLLDDDNANSNTNKSSSKEEIRKKKNQTSSSFMDIVFGSHSSTGTTTTKKSTPPPVIFKFNAIPVTQLAFDCRHVGGDALVSLRGKKTGVYGFASETRGKNEEVNEFLQFHQLPKSFDWSSRGKRVMLIETFGKTKLGSICFKELFRTKLLVLQFLPIEYSNSL